MSTQPPQSSMRMVAPLLVVGALRICIRGYLTKVSGVLDAFDSGTSAPTRGESILKLGS